MMSLKANEDVLRLKESDGEAGFTLLEVLVTLVIVSMATAAAAYSAGVGAGDGRRIAALSAKLGAEIDLLRLQALRTGRTTRLVFERETGRFLSSRPEALPIPSAPLVVDVDAGDGGEIRFLADGESSGGRIVIGAASGREVLSVGNLTGHLRREPAR